jgi:hypothetical protein
VAEEGQSIEITTSPSNSAYALDFLPGQVSNSTTITAEKAEGNMSGGTSKPALLEKERLYFEAHRNEFLQSHENLFVLIKGEELIGVFPDAQSAYNDGINRFGPEPFLVKQVLKEEPISSITFFSATTPHARL